MPEATAGGPSSAWSQRVCSHSYWYKLYIYICCRPTRRCHNCIRHFFQSARKARWGDGRNSAAAQRKLQLATKHQVEKRRPKLEKTARADPSSHGLYPKGCLQGREGRAVSAAAAMVKNMSAHVVDQLDAATIASDTFSKAPGRQGEVMAAIQPLHKGNSSSPRSTK